MDYLRSKLPLISVLKNCQYVDLALCKPLHGVFPKIISKYSKKEEISDVIQN